jgi:acyl carrier protein
MLTNEGMFMAFNSLTTQQRMAIEEGFEITVRALIADYLDVDFKRVTDEAHFTDDLGADWLDRIELMILIEDHFVGVEITDDDAYQLEFVGDLIRHIENVVHTRVVSLTVRRRACAAGR